MEGNQTIDSKRSLTRHRADGPAVVSGFETVEQFSKVIDPGMAAFQQS
jgi:hypothetical protein